MEGGVFFKELRKEGGRGSEGPVSHTRIFLDLVPPPRGTEDTTVSKMIENETSVQFLYCHLKVAKIDHIRYHFLGQPKQSLY